jgi:phosphoribosylanthranilate isomerase
MPATNMFHIKICGITSVHDAQMAARAGADAIGLNFWPRSKRYVELESARDIVAALTGDVAKVGVFVNASAEKIATTVERVGLDWIQLHGDEPAEVLAKLPPDIPILRAFRCGDDGLASLVKFLAASQTAGRSPDAVLIDAAADREYGGTGRRADWARIAEDRNLIGELPLVLAGGLTPLNVEAAIDAVRPTGVDVASGVESQPGRKNAALVDQFVSAAKAGFSRLYSGT